MPKEKGTLFNAISKRPHYRPRGYARIVFAGSASADAIERTQSEENEKFKGLLSQLNHLCTLNFGRNNSKAVEIFFDKQDKAEGVNLYVTDSKDPLIEALLDAGIDITQFRDHHRIYIKDLPLGEDHKLEPKIYSKLCKIADRSAIEDICGGLDGKLSEHFADKLPPDSFKDRLLAALADRYDKTMEELKTHQTKNKKAIREEENEERKNNWQDRQNTNSRRSRGGPSGY